MLASLCHLVIYTLSRGRQWPKDRLLWRHGAVLGIFGTAIPMTSIVSSLQFQSSGLTAVLITTSPAITVIMAHFFLPDEPLTRRKSLGVLLALGGALLLAVRGESGLPDVSRANPLGYLLVLLAMVSASGSTIYARKYMRELDAFDVASTRMVVAALVVMPLSLLLVGLDLSAVDGSGYLALIYAALVGTFSGMMLAFYNIQRFGAIAAAMTAYIIPVVAVIAGALILGETITPGMLSGMALILLGVAIINRRGRVVQEESAGPVS